ncbi:MAG: hypothetical protein ACLPXT_15220 [Terracidiphilus sp.]
MSEVVTHPTVKDIKDACKVFAGDKNEPDPALIDLFTHYPKNTDFVHVLLKVVTLNTLYSTMIRVYSEHPTVYDVARHIIDQKIDTDLDLCLPELVHKISNIDKGEKTFYNYSFATKYCSFHRPESYPIYDSRVNEYLWHLRNLGALRQFKRNALWIYPEFKKIVDEFRDRYCLQEFTYKQIDAFLFYEGGKLRKQKESKAVPLSLLLIDSN